MPQGEGWWIASDGRWYPPYLHPELLRGSSDEPSDVSGTPPFGPSVSARDEVSGLGWEDEAAEESFRPAGPEEPLADEPVTTEPVAAKPVTTEPVADVEPLMSAEAETPLAVVDVSSLIEGPVNEADLEEAAAEAAAEAEAEARTLEPEEPNGEPEVPKISLEELEAEPTAEPAAAPSMVLQEGESASSAVGSPAEGGPISEEAGEAAAAAVAEPEPEAEKPRRTIIIRTRDEFFANEQDPVPVDEDDDARSTRPKRELVLAGVLVLLLAIGGLIAGLVVGQGSPRPAPPLILRPGPKRTAAPGLRPSELDSVALKAGDMPSGWVQQSNAEGHDPLSTPAERETFVLARPGCRSVLYLFSTSSSPTVIKASSFGTPGQGTLASGGVETSVGAFPSAAAVRTDLSRITSLQSQSGGRACLSSLIEKALSSSLALQFGSHYTVNAVATRVPLNRLPHGVAGTAFEVAGTFTRGSLVYPFNDFFARLGSSKVEASLLTFSIANGGPGPALDLALVGTLAQRIKVVAGKT